MRAPSNSPITIQTYAWFARHGSELDRDTYHLVLCDEAHTALGEKTSAAIRAFHEPLYIGMTATEQLIAKQVSDVFPASVDDLPLGDAASRTDRSAPLPARAARCRDQLGADRRRRLRGARARRSPRPRGAEPGGREPLPRALRLDARDRVLGGRRARVQPRAGVPGRRPQGGGRLGEDSAGAPRRDARGLRARRDQRPHQRAAARRGWNSPRRPCACTWRRPRRAVSTSSGSAASCASTRARRRASSSTSSRRPRPTTSAWSRSTPCSTPTSTGRPRRRHRAAGSAVPPQARPSRGSSRSPRTSHGAERHPARVAANRPEVPRRGRAAVLGDDRGPPDPVRPARRVRPEVRRGRATKARSSSSSRPARPRTRTAGCG